MQTIRIALASLMLAACQDAPARTILTPPPPPTQGISAYVTVDNPDAAVGSTVRVRVEVQVGANSTVKIGSYTGRLHFDPAKLGFRSENTINDGLRVANANGAPQGEIRFAGASPTGFTTLVLYDATFQVKSADYRTGLSLTMEELSAALSLSNLSAQVSVNRQIFMSRIQNH